MANSSLRILKPSPPDLPIPTHFRCPISLDLMKDPVTVSTGITYDRDSIETWLLNRNCCPVTNQTLACLELTPNHSIRRMIQAWCVANKSLGVDRIPTPRAPLTPAQATEMLDRVSLASARRDRARFLDLVVSMRKLAKESERNRRCISSNGAGRALATSLRDFAGDEGVCSEIASALTCTFPLEDAVCRHIESPEAMRSIVSLLRSGDDLEGRLNAVLLVKELVVDKGRRTSTLAETEGLVEAVVKLIKEPISPRATKACLVTASHLALASENARAGLASSGLVSLLLEILVDSDNGGKSVSEKALGLLDGLFGDGGAREEAYGHALAVPVLVKKMFRVSDAATEFAVSGLWKLCGGCCCGGDREERRRGMAHAAVSVGAFEKLLLLLQVGCGEGTKEKASEVLRMLNGWRGTTNGDYCIDSSDFRAIKRNF